MAETEEPIKMSVRKVVLEKFEGEAEPGKLPVERIELTFDENGKLIKEETAEAGG